MFDGPLGILLAVLVSVGIALMGYVLIAGGEQIGFRIWKRKRRKRFYIDYNSGMVVKNRLTRMSGRRKK